MIRKEEYSYNKPKTSPPSGRPKHKIKNKKLKTKKDCLKELNKFCKKEADKIYKNAKDMNYNYPDVIIPISIEGREDVLEILVKDLTQKRFFKAVFAFFRLRIKGVRKSISELINEQDTPFYGLLSKLSICKIPGKKVKKLLIYTFQFLQEEGTILWTFSSLAFT